VNSFCAFAGSETVTAAISAKVGESLNVMGRCLFHYRRADLLELF
jgi:hypothetical protein